MTNYPRLFFLGLIFSVKATAAHDYVLSRIAGHFNNENTIRAWTHLPSDIDLAGLGNHRQWDCIEVSAAPGNDRMTYTEKALAFSAVEGELKAKGALLSEELVFEKNTFWADREVEEVYTMGGRTFREKKVLKYLEGTISAQNTSGDFFSLRKRRDATEVIAIEKSRPKNKMEASLRLSGLYKTANLSNENYVTGYLFCRLRDQCLDMNCSLQSFKKECKVERDERNKIKKFASTPPDSYGVSSNTLALMEWEYDNCQMPLK